MKFNPSLPIKSQSLDGDAVRIFKETAEFFLSELKHRKLEVILLPAPDPHYDGHKIRAVVNTNPQWYSDLYWRYYPNFRRDRTSNSLGRLSKLGDKKYKNIKYKYDLIMRDFIYEILMDGYQSDGFEMPSNTKFKEYFKNE